LRNLKNAIKSSPLVTLVQHHGETYICLNQENGTVSLPEMPPEFLEAHLQDRLLGNANVKQILALLVEILNEQQEYRKSYPLAGLAFILRPTFEHLKNDHNALAQESNGSNGFAPEEVEMMIHAGVRQIKSSMHPTYVGKGKVDGTTYDAYFAAIRNMLVAEYVNNDGCNRSYYDYLRQHLDSLTREEYQSRCRCHFEYLAKLTRHELLQNLKKEW
jgi:hypothetical protein